MSVHYSRRIDNFTSGIWYWLVDEEPQLGGLKYANLVSVYLYEVLRFNKVNSLSAGNI